MTALPFEVNCPKCGARLVVNDPNWIGHPVSCPDCGEVFVAEAPENSDPLSSEIFISPEIVATDAEDDFPEKNNISALPPVLSENEEFHYEEETTFYYRPFFIAGLGVIALLLLGIIFVLIWRNSQVESKDVTEVTERIDSESTSETVPLETTDETSFENKDENVEENEENKEETVVPESDEESSADLTRNLETEFFKPSDLSVEETPETELDHDATPIVETTSDEVVENVDSTPSAETAVSTQSSPTETPPSSPSSSPSDSAEKDQEPDFETFSAREPDSLAGAIPTIKGENAIDIPKRLSLSVKRIRLAEKSLPEVIRVISELSGIPIELDVDSLPFPVETFEKRVNLEMGEFTVGVILQKAAEFYGLESETFPDRIRLTLSKKEKETIHEFRFDVSDIVAGTSEEGDESVAIPNENEEMAWKADFTPVFPALLSVKILRDYLKDFLTDEWRVPLPSLEQGEPATNAEPLKMEGSEIILSSNEKIAEEADSLLERIRNIRHLSPKTDKMAEELIPETLGWEKMMKPASLQFLAPVSLREALILLEASQEIRFLTDLPEMKSIGTNLDAPVKISAAGVPLDQILTELLAPLNLTYVILTEDLLWITSREKADQKMTTEIHFYASPGETVSQEFLNDLIRRVKSEVNPSSWRSDKTEKGGILWADPLSGSFLIRQSQPTQRAIRRFIMKAVDSPRVPSSEESSKNEQPPSLEGEPSS